MCSLRMWTYGLTYVMVWGSLALKTYRVKTLVVDQADQHSQARVFEYSREYPPGH